MSRKARKRLRASPASGSATAASDARATKPRADPATAPEPIRSRNAVIGAVVGGVALSVLLIVAAAVYLSSR